MARRGGRRRGRRGGMKLPIISLAILAGQAAFANGQGATILQKVNAFQALYTGISFSEGSPVFVPQLLVAGYGPWVAKRFIGAIARPRVNMHGLPISLS